MVREIKTIGDAERWLERRGTKPDEIRWIEPIRQRIIDWLRSNQARKPATLHGEPATTREPER